MIEGTCPRCGLRQFGCGLLNPRYQTCPDCHTALVITEEGRPLMQGFSPFTSERLEIPAPAGQPSAFGEWKEELPGN